jgi:hypothetical protein
MHITDEEKSTRNISIGENRPATDISPPPAPSGAQSLPRAPEVYLLGLVEAGSAATPRERDNAAAALLNLIMAGGKSMSKY